MCAWLVEGSAEESIPSLLTPCAEDVPQTSPIGRLDRKPAVAPPLVETTAIPEEPTAPQTLLRDSASLVSSGVAA